MHTRFEPIRPGVRRLQLSAALCVGLFAGCDRSGATPAKPSEPVPEPLAAAVDVASSEVTHVDAPVVAPPTATKRVDVAEALRYDPNDPLGNLEAADVLDRGGARAASRKVVVPARGCAIAEEPRRVWSRPGVARVVAFGDGFVVAGYTQGDAAEDQVFVVHVTGKSTLEPVATLPLAVKHPTERTAAPGLAADASQGVVVAYADGSGTLYAQTLRVGAAHGGGAALTLARGVDTRFAPAVGFGKRGALIAYTLGTTPMRSMLVRLDPRGQVLASHDVTPPAMGAAAPVFVSGASGGLITADARNGMSPIARTQLDVDGKPGGSEVVLPVGMMSQPPELAAAQADFGSYIAYTGLGSAATSAVGVVRVAPKPGAPEAFVKGTAYGALHVAAVGGKNVVLIAADAPLHAGKKPLHDIQVAQFDARGQGPMLRVAAPSGDATHASISRSEHAGVALAFTAPDGVYLTRLRCAGL